MLLAIMIREVYPITFSIFRYDNCFLDNAVSIMKLGMNDMVWKGEWVLLFFYEKDEKNHCVHACSGDVICRLSDCVFL